MRRIQIKACAVILLGMVLGGCNRSPEAKSARYIAAGKELMEKHDPNRAILQFLNAAQATPQNAEAYYQLGQAYLASGDLKRGVANLRRALELNPKHKPAQLSLARLETGTNDPELLQDAKDRLESLLEGTPQDPDALHSLALTEMKLGTPEDAVQHLESALLAAPADLVIAATLAEAKQQQKDNKGAEEVLKSACEKAPKSADAPVLLGRFYSTQKRYDEAAAEFQKALSLAPNHMAALLNLANLQYQLGRKQEAEQNFKRLSTFSDKSVNPDYGVFLFQQGRKDEAIREFERLAKQDPNDRAARTRLIAAYQSANRPSEAEKILSDALKKNPKDLDALLQRSEFLMAAKKYADAEFNLSQVVHLKPDSPEAHYTLGKLYEATAKPQLMQQEFNEALRLNPFLLAVRLEEARALTADNQGAAAMAILDGAPPSQKNLLSILQERNWALLAAKQEAEARKGVERGLATARTPDLLIQSAVLKISDRRYDEARQALREALTKNPEDVRALRLWVRSYSAQNQVNTAVTEVRAYVVQHPKSAAVQFFLGQLLIETGDREGAKQAITAARQLNPEFAQTDLYLAQINLLQANWQGARQELDTILSTSKGEDLTARQWLGMLEVSVGNQAAAITDFRKVVEAQPNNALALNNLAYLLAENGQADEALKHAQKALELAPDNPSYADTLGWVLYRKGVYNAAVTHLKTAVSKGGDVRPEYHLAMAYFKAGEEGRGRDVLQAALRKDPNVPEAKLAAEVFQNKGRP